MQVVELGRPDDIAAHAPAWDELARRHGALFFQSSVWVESWWRTVEPRARVSLLIDGPADQPHGVLAVARLRRHLHPRLPGWVTLPFLGLAGSGFGAADALGPVAGTEDSARRLLGTAAKLAGRSPLVLDNVDPRFQSAAAALDGAIELTTVRRPGLDLTAHETVDQLWSAKMRKNLRRRESLLAGENISRRWVHLDGSSRREFLELERLHDSLWASRGQPGLFGSRRMALFEDLARSSRRLGSDDGLWMQLIERDGRAIAMLFGLRFGRVFCSYKTGWDTAFTSLGLGVLLHSAAIRWAHGQGLARYEFLRGANPHKYSLGGIDQFDATYVVPNGPVGRALLARDRLSLQRSQAAAPGEGATDRAGD